VQVWETSLKASKNFRNREKNELRARDAFVAQEAGARKP
jgi:hypothetical protein